MVSFDKGPPAPVARHLARLPDIPPDLRPLFWYDWGPVFYRGRLNRRGRLLGIASDPGPTERIVGRTLVGDAGQRVQGFLERLGLTSSYTLVNAFPVAVHPSQVSRALPFLADPDQLAWRNRFYDMVVGPDLQAIVAFGGNARRALELWDPRPDVPVFEISHPSNHNEDALLDQWRAAVPALREVVTPDPDGTVTGADYGTDFTEGDYRPIPAADLPFGLPDWVGDDAWGRLSTPKRHNAVERLRGDTERTLAWRAPTAQQRERARQRDSGASL